MTEEQHLSIAIIGASKDRDKYGNKAVRAYQAAGYDVYPINPNEDEVEGLTCYHSIAELPDGIKTLSFYVPPNVGENIAEDLPQKGIEEAYLNPGTESDELIRRLEAAGITVIRACSIRMIGADPHLL